MTLSVTDNPPSITSEPTADHQASKKGAENDKENKQDTPTNQEKVIEKISSPTTLAGRLKYATKELIKMAVPVSLVCMFDYLAILFELIFCGMFGTAALGGGALAASFANVTGYSIVYGLLLPLDTLISQAFGANQKDKIGLALQRALIVSFVVTLLIFPIWFFSGELMRILHQDEEVIPYVQIYLRVSWFGLFGSAINYALRRYLMNQNIIFPIFIVGLCGLYFTFFANFLLIYLLGFGFTTVPVIHVICSYFQVMVILSIILLFKLHRGTWCPWSLQTISGIWPYCKLALATTVGMCSEWWGFEIHTLIAGLFGVVSLAAMTIVMNILAVLFMTILGFSMAVSVLVGNAVGAEDIRLAKITGRVGLVLALLVQLVQITLFYGLEDYWPRLFSQDEEVIEKVQEIVPIVCSFMIPDALQNILGGNLRGMGKVHFQAMVNLMAYYVVGMVVALVLAFYFDMGIVGQWIGLACGNTFSFVVQSIGYGTVNWSKVIEESKKRLKEHAWKQQYSEESKVEIEMEQLDDEESSVPDPVPSVAAPIP